MPKMVIWVAEFKYENLEMEARLFHPGDVIQVLPDDHEFSKEEIENPLWRIVDVDMPILEAKSFESEEQGETENPLLRKRQFHIDLEAISQASKSILDEPVTAQTIAIDANELRAARSVKEPVLVKQIIGSDNRQVLG